MKAAIVKTATLKTLVSSLVLLGGLSQVAQADANPNLVQAGTSLEGNLTGNIGVYSKYVLRGITNAPEQDGAAVQGGVDYVLKNGFYAGYWFSSLGYSADPAKTGNSVESNFVGGYTGAIDSTGIGYTIGGTVYVYTPGKDTTAFETKLGLSYGSASITAQTLLNDVTFGNKGDTYFLASYAHALPKDFTLTGQVGAYAYKKDGEFLPETADSEGFAFRHATIALSHPLPVKGGTWGVQYIIGGSDRYGVHQDNTIVGSLALTF